MSVHIARVASDGVIHIYRDDQRHPVAIIELPLGGSLRHVLHEAGWQPSGRKPPSSDWGAIYVEPTR